MKTIIQALLSEKVKLIERITDIDNAVKSFQKVCKHVNEDGTTAYEYDGHDSHHDYVKCVICQDSKKN